MARRHRHVPNDLRQHRHTGALQEAYVVHRSASSRISRTTSTRRTTRTTRRRTKRATRTTTRRRPTARTTRRTTTTRRRRRRTTTGILLYPTLRFAHVCSSSSITALTSKADLRDRPAQLIISARCSLAPFGVWLPTAPERAAFRPRWTRHAGRPCCSRRQGAAPAQQQCRFLCGVFDPKANRSSFGIAQGL